MEKIRSDFELEWSCGKRKIRDETEKYCLVLNLAFLLIRHILCTLLAASVSFMCGAAHVARPKLVGRLCWSGT